MAGSSLRPPLLFSLGCDDGLAPALAQELALPLSPLEERQFEDGEHKIRPLVDVRGFDACVIASLHGDAKGSANDKLCKLLFFVACLKTNGAGKVTVIAPYLCYMRKDRQTKPQDPLTGLYVAQLLETSGADEVVTLEAHNLAAFQNAFRRPTIHLTAHAAFADHFSKVVGTGDACVVSPDLGGGKRAEAFRELLEAKLGRPATKGFLEKQRSMGRVSGDLFAGDVAGRVAIIVDDLISSGTTMIRAANACRTHGAVAVHICATHALFSASARENLASAGLEGIVVTDTIGPDVARGLPSATVIPVADIIAAAMVLNPESSRP